MAKPPIPILPYPADAPEWLLTLWPNILLDWQFDWSTSAARIAARAFNSAVQSIANGTIVPLTFDSETFDIGGLHSTTVATSKFTVPSGQNGMYLAVGQVEFAANAAGVRTLLINKNGTQIAGQNIINPGAGAIAALNVASQTTLIGGDFIEFAAFQNSGGALNTVAGDGVTYGSLARLW